MSKELAGAYSVVFASMHVAAFILGLRIVGVGDVFSGVAMLLFAFLCVAGLLWDNKVWRLFLAVGWGVAVMVEWMHLIQWIPAFSDLQYVVIAVLNMGMALSVAVLSEVFQ